MYTASRRIVALARSAPVWIPRWRRPKTSGGMLANPGGHSVPAPWRRPPALPFGCNPVFVGIGTASRGEGATRGIDKWRLGVYWQPYGNRNGDPEHRC